MNKHIAPSQTPTPADTEYVVIGKVGSSYGVKGWCKVQTYTENPTDIFDYQPWYLSRDQRHWQQYHLTDHAQHAETLLAKLADIDDPETARLLTGNLIGIKREQLPTLASNEYYWSDLIGLTVIDQHGKSLGTVTHLLDTGANDVLIVKGETEHAIPFLLGKVITKVDLAAHIIHVDWEPL